MNDPAAPVPNPSLDRAFILAAGKGTRLRPYTDSIPKPMVTVGGRSIIHRTIQKLADVGVQEVVVNLHHLAPVLEAHLEEIKHPALILSHEEELLETGGGVQKALQHFKGEPFFLINGDALWDDAGDKTALARLSDFWDSDKMDLLLLLQPVRSMKLTHGVGDYVLEADGKARRKPQRDGDMMFAGIRIVHPRLFEGAPEGSFSFLSLMDKAQQNDRLYALAHEGDWHHISTPEELERVDEAFNNGTAR